MRLANHPIAEVTPKLTPRVWAEISGRCHVSDPAAIQSFLRQNPAIVPLLRDSPAEIKSVFGNSPIILSISQDQDIPGWTQLDVEICTRLSAKQATKLLAEFDDAWGIACTSAAGGKICFLLRPQ